MTDKLTRVDKVDPAERLGEYVEQATAANRQVRIRVELRLYDSERQVHKAWPDSAFTVDVPAKVEVGMAVRESVLRLIDVLTAEGPQKAIERLTMAAEQANG